MEQKHTYDNGRHDFYAFSSDRPSEAQRKDYQARITSSARCSASDSECLHRQHDSAIRIQPSFETHSLGHTQKRPL